MPSPSQSRPALFLIGSVATILLIALVLYLLFVRFDVPWY